MRVSIPTRNSDDKYFYLINKEYYSYSSSIYMYLEDNYFGLNYKDIKCCLTNTNPGYDSAYVVDHCWFASIGNYTYQSASSFD